MKKIFIPIIALLGFSACQDCKDCTVYTDASVRIETTLGTYTDTTITYSDYGTYTPGPGFSSYPSLYQERCGTDLKDIDGKTITTTQIDTSTTAGIRYTHTWTETWDCK